MTLLQSKIEPDKMGRVFSVMMMFSGLAMPLAMLVFGPLGDVVQIEWLLIASGIVIFASGLALFGMRSLLAMGK